MSKVAVPELGVNYAVPRAKQRYAAATQGLRVLEAMDLELGAGVDRRAIRAAKSNARRVIAETSPPRGARDGHTICISLTRPRQAARRRRSPRRRARSTAPPGSSGDPDPAQSLAHGGRRNGV